MPTAAPSTRRCDRVVQAVSRRIRPAPDQVANALRYWQEWVLRIMLLACVVLGLGAYIPSLWLSVKERLWGVALLDTLVYIWILFVFIRHGMPYWLRSGSLVAATYLVGVVLLVVVGPFGAGPVWLFTFPVIAGILLGRRAGLLGLVLNAVTVTAVGASIRAGIMDWPIPAVNPEAKWVVSSVNFMLLNAVATISISVLLHGLRQSLSEEKRLRTEVEENRRRLETILDTVHTGILIIDAETLTIADANPSAVVMIGAPKECIVGASCSAYLPAGLAPGRNEAPPSGNTVSGEAVVTTASGRGRPVLLNTVAVSLDGRRHLLASFLDISRLRQAEEDRAALEAELAQTRKMEALGTLSGGIAHDFNNILAGLIGFTELALEMAADDVEMTENLEGIYRAAQRARDLVAQILAFSRRDECRPAPVRVMSVLTETLSLFRAALPAGVTVRTVFEIDPVAMVDATQFHQVLMNLLTNARHAVSGGGVIEIGLDAAAPPTPRDAPVDTRPGWLHVWVGDNGCGIPDDVKARMFEPFFTTRSAGAGSGMGLAVVHGIMERHSGMITVDSAEGQGTRVHLYLPRALAGDLSAEAPAPAAAGGTEHILLVDDDETVLRVTRSILERLNYAVSTASSGAAALERVKTDGDGIDLVITDIAMPGLSGIELLDALNEHYPRLPVVLLTGDPGPEGERTAIAHGAAALAVKPLTRADLGRLIRRALDDAAAGRPA